MPSPSHRRSRPPAWTDPFLELFRATGNVRLAAHGAGIDRTTPYARAARDPAFAAAWAAATEDAIDVLEAEARRRAMAYSDRLLEFLLRALRPEVYGARLAVRLDVRRAAERLAARIGRPVDELLAEAERLAGEEGAP